MNRQALLAAAVAVLALNGAYAALAPGVVSRLAPTHPYGYYGGQSPVGTTAAHFVDVTARTGIDARRSPWAEHPAYDTILAGGLAIQDVDGDGWEDLYVPPGGPGIPAHLYVNQRDWTFRDEAVPAGLAVDGVGLGAAFGDYDNDGRPDLAVAIGSELHVYHHDAGLAFSDATASLGIRLGDQCPGLCQPSSLAWLDHDGDGLADLLVVDNLDWHESGLHRSGDDYTSLVSLGRAQRTFLWRNTGTAFQDVSFDAGFLDSAKGLGITTADLDADGHADILTANDVSRNGAFLSVGSDPASPGVYRNDGHRLGLDRLASGMGIAAADMTGDGRTDVVVSNLRAERLAFMAQQPDGTFRHVTHEGGLDVSGTVTGWGLALFDADLDGHLDIAHAAGRPAPLGPHYNDLGNVVQPDLREDTRDQLFAGDGAGHFVDVTDAAGFGDDGITRGLAAADLDNDGDLDVVRIQLDGAPLQVLRNDVIDASRHDPGAASPASAHWLQVVLHGANQTDGLGARLTVTTPDGATQTQDRASSAGYQTGVCERVAFGLGASASADLEVHWPDGTAQTLRGVHGLITVHQGPAAPGVNV